MTRSKRIFSMVLAVVMCIGMLSTIGMAASETGIEKYSADVKLLDAAAPTEDTDEPDEAVNAKRFRMKKLLMALIGMQTRQKDAVPLKAAKLYVNGVAASTVNVGDTITLAVTPAEATGTVSWTVGGTEINNTTSTYTVTAFDMGKTIKAEITGTGSYIGTVSAKCTVANTTEVTAEDIMSDEADSSPVVLTNAENTKFLNDGGVEVDVDASATLTLSIESAEKDEDEVSEATELVIEKIKNDNVGVSDEALSDVTAVAVDVDLSVNDTPVHPVGDVTVTLSAAQLGLDEETDLSKYVFTANHTNKEGVSETVDGVVVTIDGVQYVRFELNGLSTIWIGNVPPRTVSFYITEDDADSKVNSIGSVIVKFGDLTPTLQIPTPSRSGYLFCGWNYDMTRTPIITNLEVHALWVRGEKVPSSNINVTLSEDASALDVEITDGSISIDSDDIDSLSSNLSAEVTVSAPSNAVKYYVGTNAAEVAAFEDEDEFIAISSDSTIGFEFDITDTSGLLISSTYTYYYKWIDAEGSVISVQEVKARIANGSDTATSMVYTENVDRGIGRFEAYLIDSEDDTKDYVGYINNNLSGAVFDGYTLRNNVSFDGYKIGYNFSSYDTLKLIFTPFEGESYDADDTVTALGEYLGNDMWNDEWSGSYEIADGKLTVTYPFDVTKMTANFANVTVSVNDNEQLISVHWDHGASVVSEIEYIDITCETWAEVLEQLKSISSENRYSIYCTESSEITLSSSLTIPANVDIHLSNAPSFTVANGATLTFTDDSLHACASYFYIQQGDFIVADGGTVTSAYTGGTNGSRWIPSLRASNVIFKSGASLTLPQNTFLGIYYHHSYSDAETGVCTFENGSAINNSGRLNIQNFDTLNLNGTFNATADVYLYNDETNIGGSVSFNNDAYEYLEIYGTVNIAEAGSLVVNSTYSYLRTVLEIYGPLTNRGTIEIKGKTNAVIMNNGFANYNAGTISVAADCSIQTTGTKFINTGTITGEGEINAYLGDDYTNYDDGTEYVTVENSGYWDEELNKYIYNLADYSRYKYTHTPAATVDVILYLSEIVNMGDGQCTVAVNAEDFPE